MTPPAASTIAGRAPGTTRRSTHGTGHRSAAPRAPRRVSGPVRRASRLGAPRPAVATAGSGALAAPLGLRLARRVSRVPDAPVLDRLIRGRAWIAIVAVGLMGLVFMQVSLLKLNTGISHAVQSAQTLERQNIALRGQVSRLGDGQRIEGAAATAGMVLPAAGQYRYLDAGKADPRRAAQAITAPDPVVQQPAAAATTTTTAGIATSGPGTGVAATQTAAGPSATTTATTAAAPTTTAGTAPQTSGTTPQTTGAATALTIAPTTQQQQPAPTGGVPGAAATTPAQP